MTREEENFRNGVNDAIANRLKHVDVDKTKKAAPKNCMEALNRNTDKKIKKKLVTSIPKTK